MIHETIDIDIDYEALGLKHDATKATITTYIKDVYPNDQHMFNRPLIIICPGGGYHHHSPREGEPIALKMLDMGYNAVILRYSLTPNEFPCALYELAYTVNYVRKHAGLADSKGDWDVDANNIVVAGFSAGGHVAASLGTMYNQKELEPFLSYMGITAESVRPDRMLLSYSVLTSGEFAHRDSFTRILGERYDELLETVDLVKRVSEDTPECFIWHTFSDGSVPVENSLMFAKALREHGISFEMHIFPLGHHGIALGTKETDTKDGKHCQPEVYAWTQLFKTWLDNATTRRAYEEQRL